MGMTYQMQQAGRLQAVFEVMPGAKQPQVQPAVFITNSDNKS